MLSCSIHNQDQHQKKTSSLRHLTNTDQHLDSCLQTFSISLILVNQISIHRSPLFKMSSSPRLRKYAFTGYEREYLAGLCKDAEDHKTETAQSTVYKQITDWYNLHFHKNPEQTGWGPTSMQVFDEIQTHRHTYHPPIEYPNDNERDSIPYHTLFN